MREEFTLPEEDTEYLESNKYKWECIKDGKHRWLIIYDYPVPDGYNIKKVNIALRIDPGYPVSQIDMAYFSPALSLNSGNQIPALANQVIEGKNWQRWSRHRTNQNPWRPGFDNVCTHLQLVNFWFERELNK